MMSAEQSSAKPGAEQQQLEAIRALWVRLLRLVATEVAVQLQRGGGAASQEQPEPQFPNPRIPFAL
jgi:hypothetical protein